MTTRLACLVLPWIAACTSTPASPFHEHLDRETGITVSRMNQAMIFYDPETSAPPPTEQRERKPSRHFEWRDYLYLGPLEINRTGERTYYMWASLVRRERPEAAESPSGIAIVADGMSIELTVLTRDRSVLGAREPTYPAPAPWAAELYLPVSAEQLEQIAAASQLTARVRMPSDRELPFEPARENQAGLRDFVRFVVEGQIW